MKAGLTSAPIGIVGGGQLAGMLVEAAHHLGLPVHVLSDSPDDPAMTMHAYSPFEVRWFDARARAQQRAFLKLTDTVIIESEWAPLALLKNARQAVPSVSALSELSNKFLQKQLLKQLRIPTAAFVSCKAQDDARFLQHLERAHRKLGPELMLKFAQFGYDGKGCFKTQIGAPQHALPFFRQAQKMGTFLYAETCVDFEQEAALIAVRGGPLQGHPFVHYPMVWTWQRDGICDVVQGPATSLQLPRATEARAVGYAKRLASALGLRGTFAIEWFVLDGGRTLLVNEIAPRVHNSGHFSQNAAGVSQFENHLRACLDLPLGSTLTAPEFGMVNWIGLETRTLKPGRVPHRWIENTRDAGGIPHFYQKREERPGRKMGHCNFDSWRGLRYFLERRKTQP